MVKRSCVPSTFSRITTIKDETLLMWMWKRQTRVQLKKTTCLSSDWTS